MAEKETKKTLNDIPSDEDSTNMTRKGLSNQTLIKIAIGLLALLILAGGAYFFFMSADEPTSEEAAVEINEEIISPELTPSTPTPEYTAKDIQILQMREKDIRILQMREEAVTLKEENLQLKERLRKLKNQQNSNVETTEPAVETTEPAVDTTTSEDDEKISEAALKPKLKTNQYSNLYSRDYIMVRKPQREPPEPKWGDFDPLYRRK